MRNKYTWIFVVLLTLAFGGLGFSVGRLSAAPGTLDSPGPPESTLSYTLEDIYNRLDTGAAGSPSAFTEPASGPTVGTGHTLSETMAVAPAADNANGVVPAEVLTGKTYWSLRTDGSGGSSWGLETGTAAAGDNVSGPEGARTFTIPDGFYSGAKTATANDSDLLAGHIAQGVDIFGVVGTYPLAPVPKTGQTNSYATGDDGDLEKGVAWPTPRFTDNGDGTVTDNLTGLIWLKNANCFGQRTWTQALSDANTLNSGECGLGDGSSEGDWRLPNVRELESLIDYGRYNPALPSGHPFTGVLSYRYWSSTTLAYYTPAAWGVNLGVGWVYYGVDKTSSLYVWPNRGGQ